jgi:hypothetical protein
MQRYVEGDSGGDADVVHRFARILFALEEFELVCLNLSSDWSGCNRSSGTVAWWPTRTNRNEFRAGYSSQISVVGELLRAGTIPAPLDGLEARGM